MGQDRAINLGGFAFDVTMDDLLYQLGRLGFSDKESAVYLSCLQHPGASVSDVAKWAQVNRATAYPVLETLCSRGLVTSVVREGGDRVFRAEPPERLLTLLRVQHAEMQERLRGAESLLPRLDAFFNARNEKPKIRYIEGLDGLRAMRQEHERYEDDIIQMVGYDAFLLLHDPRDSRAHRSALGQAQRRVRSILVTAQPVTFPPGVPIEHVTVSPDFLSADGEISVSGDRVVLFSFKDRILAVEITSRAIAQTMRASLELAWAEAKRLQSALS